jgi:hypothetical protein
LNKSTSSEDSSTANLFNNTIEIEDAIVASTPLPDTAPRVAIATIYYVHQTGHVKIYISGRVLYLKQIDLDRI